MLRNSATGETRSLGEVAVGPGGVRHFGTVAALGGWDTCDLSWESADAVLWTRQLLVPAATALNTYGGLFVEDSQRKLVLLLRPVLTQSAQLNRLNGSTTVPTPAGDFTRRGRGLTELSTIRPWQLPVHPGPLTAVRTVLLSPLLSPEQLSDVQYRALARWVALGGVVMLSEESPGMLERLQQHLPLQSRPAVMLDGLKTYCCGQGMIRQFVAAEFGQEDSATMAVIGEAVAAAVSSPLFARLSQRQQLQESAGITVAGNEAILALFGLYAVAAALPIVMFRSTRQRQISWLAGVVLTASAGAGALGFAIRNRPGDLSLQTLTWIGEDCLVQAAGITLRSAGRTPLQLEVSGAEPDLQASVIVVNAERLFAGMSGNWRSSDWMETSGNSAWAAFNLAKSDSADPVRCSISVPVSPWSSRQVTGVDLGPLEGRLEVAVESIDSSSSQPGLEKWHQAAAFPDGAFRLRLRNSLPFRLRECRLGMILWRRPATAEAEWLLFRRMVDLPELAADADSSVATVDLELNPGSEWIADSVGVNAQYSEISSRVPEGEMEVWVEGQLESSPLMQLEGVDFRESRPAEHWFYYRVPRGNLPEGWRDLQEWKTPTENK
jgi:hypothetical protein